MKCLFIVLALLFCAPLPAQAPEPMPLAHGNTPGEPHHHLKIENEYVRVYYVEVPPHENTQLHQHDHDYLFVTLGDSDVINAVRDKPEVHLVLKDGETHFARGGFAHVARNLSDAPFRNITIELLRPQADPENLCTEILLSAPKSVCPRTFEAYRAGPAASVVPQFHSAATFLNLVSLDAEMRGAKIAVPENSLLVALDDCQVQIDMEGSATKTLHGYEVTWIDANSRAAASNPSKKPSSYLQLSFRDSNAIAKP